MKNLKVIAPMNNIEAKYPPEFSGAIFDLARAACEISAACAADPKNRAWPCPLHKIYMGGADCLTYAATHPGTKPVLEKYLEAQESFEIFEKERREAEMEAEAEAFESFIKGRKLMRLPIHGAAKAVNSPTTNWWKIATSGRLLMSGYVPKVEEEAPVVAPVVGAHVRDATEEYASSKPERDKARHGKAKNAAYSGHRDSAANRYYKRAHAHKRRRCFLETSARGWRQFVSNDALYINT